MKAKYALFPTVVLLLALLCACGVKPVTGESTTSASLAQSTVLSTQEETQTDAPAVAPSETKEAKLYADYLKNGGYEEILFEDYDDPETEYEAEAVLADVNYDGVYELLLKITNKSFMGVRGYSSVTVLLGVRDGKVERLGFAEYGGGSGGGDYLLIKYDTLEQKHVLEYEEYVRDGIFASTHTLYYFDGTRYEAQEAEYGLGGTGFVNYKPEITLRTNTLCKEGVYADDAKNLLQENELCVQEDDFVTSYTYNGAFISEDGFFAWCDRFVEPTDPAYQMKTVTLENPIPAD